MSRGRVSGWFILTSFVVSLLFALWPLPPMLAPARPYLAALLLIYWVLEAPDKVGMFWAFVLGLVLDVVTGTLLGAHAVSLVLIAYLTDRFRLRLRFFPIAQQTLAVLALLINDQVITLWINGLRGHAAPGIAYWLAPVLGAMLWPWCFLALDALRQRVAR